MRDLHEMSLGHRVMLTVAIVVIILILLAAFGYFTGRWEAEAQNITSSKWDHRMIELDKQAVDQSYILQMSHVFSIWMKDGVTDSSRARIGFANARKGYDAAMTEIERRETNAR
jgi:hypothetical protein